MYLSPNFCSNPWSLPLPSNLYPRFNGIVMMKEYLVWRWIPSPIRFGWFLKYCPLLNHVMSRIREGTHFLPSRWHSSNLSLMSNLVFGGQIPPKALPYIFGSLELLLESFAKDALLSSRLAWAYPRPRPSQNRPKLFREWVYSFRPTHNINSEFSEKI